MGESDALLRSRALSLRASLAGACSITSPQSRRHSKIATILGKGKT
jgi:hypothetical protein